MGNRAQAEVAGSREKVNEILMVELDSKSTKEIAVGKGARKTQTIIKSAVGKGASEHLHKSKPTRPRARPRRFQAL